MYVRAAERWCASLLAKSYPLSRLWRKRSREILANVIGEKDVTRPLETRPYDGLCAERIEALGRWGAEGSATLWLGPTGALRHWGAAVFELVYGERIAAIFDPFEF